MACVIEDWKHEGVALLKHFLFDYGFSKLHCSFDVTIEIVLFIALPPDAGIPVCINHLFEEWIMRIGVGPIALGVVGMVLRHNSPSASSHRRSQLFDRVVRKIWSTPFT